MTDPAQLALRPLWTSEALLQPGNLTVNHLASNQRVWVNGGWHHVHQFNLEGRRLDTHALGTDVTAADLRCYFGRPRPLRDDRTTRPTRFGFRCSMVAAFRLPTHRYAPFGHPGCVDRRP